jgi:hypothetical protein
MMQEQLSGIGMYSYKLPAPVVTTTKACEMSPLAHLDTRVLQGLWVQLQ